MRGKHLGRGHPNGAELHGFKQHLLDRRYGHASTALGAVAALVRGVFGLGSLLTCMAAIVPIVFIVCAICMCAVRMIFMLLHCPVTQQLARSCKPLQRERKYKQTNSQDA